MSLKQLLDPKVDVDWPSRFLITDSQRVRDPIKWRKSAVMSQRWRLVNGTQLFDIHQDPGQKNDIAGNHPDQVAKMREFYEKWWTELLPTFSQTTEIYVGHPEARRVTLTGHDWIQQGLPPWNQGHIRRASGYAPAQHNRNQQKSNEKNQRRKIASKHQGHWAIKVIRPGTYKVSILRWPEESQRPILAELPAGTNVPGASKAFRAQKGVAIETSAATIRVDGKNVQTKPVQPDDKSVTFQVKLSAGSHQLAPFFQTVHGELGAYYAIVEPTTVD